MSKKEVIEKSREKLKTLNSEVQNINKLFEKMNGSFNIGKVPDLIDKICNTIEASDFLDEEDYCNFFNGMKALYSYGEDLNGAFMKLSRDFCSFSFIEFYAIGIELLEVGINDTDEYTDTLELFYEGKVEFWIGEDGDPEQEHVLLTTPEQVWRVHDATRKN